jgi:GTPase
MTFTLAIIGRPNVGKSTLFNRLVGKKLALVDDRPGVTRDLREGEARLGDLRFTVIDTAGLEEADGRQPRRPDAGAVGEGGADGRRHLFLIDARAGVLPQDSAFADLLRRTGKTVILGVNKARGGGRELHPRRLPSSASATRSPVGRARRGDGGALRPPAAAMVDAAEAAAAECPEQAELAEKPIQIAVMGRPNAGKSTLVNAIFGSERLLTSPEAGTTRDAIAVEVVWGGTPMRIFDTAGMRKRAKVQEKLEKMSVSDGLRAIKFAEVVVLLLDVSNPFETQDLRFADLAEREGRCVVVAVNKWDLATNRQAQLGSLREGFDTLLPQLRARRR